MPDQMAERMRKRKKAPRRAKPAGITSGLTLLLVAAGTTVAGIVGVYTVLDNRLERIEQASEVLEKRIAEAQDILGHELNVTREDLEVRIDHSQEVMREDFKETWKVLQNEVAARPTNDEVARAIVDRTRDFRTSQAIEEMIDQSIGESADGLAALIRDNSERIELASADMSKFSESLADTRTEIFTAMVTKDEMAHVDGELESARDSIALVREQSTQAREEILADMDARFVTLLSTVEQVDDKLAGFATSEEVAAVVDDRTASLVDTATLDNALASAGESLRAEFTRAANRQAQALVEPLTVEVAEMQTRMSEAGKFLDANMATKEDLRALREEIVASAAHQIDEIASEYVRAETFENLLSQAIRNARAEMMAVIDAREEQHSTKEISSNDSRAEAREPLASALNTEPPRIPFQKSEEDVEVKQIAMTSFPEPPAREVLDESEKPRDSPSAAKEVWTSGHGLPSNEYMSHGSLTQPFETN